jgi:hypothetical protein
MAYAASPTVGMGGTLPKSEVFVLSRVIDAQKTFHFKKIQEGR